MTALEALQTLRNLGVKLEVADGRLQYASPPRTMTDTLRDFLRDHKIEIIDILTTGNESASVGDVPQTARDAADRTGNSPAPLPLFDNPLHAELHAAGYLVWNSGEAEAQLSRFVSLLLIELNGTWRLLRCRWKPDERMAAEERQIAEMSDHSAAVKRASSYLRWTRKKAGERS